MVLDLPLRNSRLQAVDLKQNFPLLWSIMEENEKAMWFHRAEEQAPPEGQKNQATKQEEEPPNVRALRSQL